MPVLAVNLSDIFVLLGGGITFLATAVGAGYGITRYVLRGIRQIAKEEIQPQHELLAQITQQNADVLKHLEQLEARTANNERDVSHLKGWTQGFTAGAQARKETSS